MSLAGAGFVPKRSTPSRRDRSHPVNGGSFHPFHIIRRPRTDQGRKFLYLSKNYSSSSAFQRLLDEPILPHQGGSFSGDGISRRRKPGACRGRVLEGREPEFGGEGGAGGLAVRGRVRCLIMPPAAYRHANPKGLRGAAPGAGLWLGVIGGRLGGAGGRVLVWGGWRRRRGLRRRRGRH